MKKDYNDMNFQIKLSGESIGAFGILLMASAIVSLAICIVAAVYLQSHTFSKTESDWLHVVSTMVLLPGLVVFQTDPIVMTVMVSAVAWFIALSLVIGVIFLAIRTALRLRDVKTRSM